MIEIYFRNTLKQLISPLLISYLCIYCCRKKGIETRAGGYSLYEIGGHKNWSQSRYNVLYHFLRMFIGYSDLYFVIYDVIASFLDLETSIFGFYVQCYVKNSPIFQKK